MNTNTTTNIHIAIVDNHQAITEYTADYFRQHSPRINVVFLARDGRDMQQQLATCNPLPNVVVMDIKMPNMDGYKATEWLAAHHPDIRVLVYTAIEHHEAVRGFLRYGVRAFISKSCASDELINAIYQLADTGKHINGYVSEELVRKADKGRLEAGHETITGRQLEILRLLASGQSDKEIARALYIEVTTVRDHINKAREKFGARDRYSLIAEAYERGILHRLDAHDG